MNPDPKSHRKRIVILGPTASGKTSHAADLAHQLETGVISADSRQCYKFMNIGTAKPGPDILKKAPHYYISELEPDRPDTARDFRRKCDQLESGPEFPHGKTVVYAGGSTLYLQALLFDLDDIPPPNPENLQQLKDREAKSGIETLYQELQQTDPEYAAKMDGMNRHRIFRALDVHMQTGKPFSSFHSGQDFSRPRPSFRVFGLDLPRKTLHERINTRVDQMLEEGLIEEVRELIKSYDPGLQALQTVGYSEVIQYLNGEITKEQMTADIKTNTRRYARRQLTWFRRWPFIEWVDGFGVDVEEILGRMGRLG